MNLYSVSFEGRRSIRPDTPAAEKEAWEEAIPAFSAADALVCARVSNLGTRKGLKAVRIVRIDCLHTLPGPVQIE